MNNSLPNRVHGARAGAVLKSSTLLQTLHKLAVLGLVLLAAGLLASPAQAQFVHLKASELRVTVPVGSTLATVVTNLVSLSGINGSGAALNVVGLPTGATAGLSPSIAPTNNTPVLMTINTANVAEGVYTFGLTAAATDTNSHPQTNVLLFTLQVGFIWNGGTNVTLNGSSLLSSANWLGGIPGIADDLIFNDLGGQSNSFISGVLTPNIVIDTSTTNASARFAQTNANKFYTIQLNPGVTWSLTGSNGFSMLRDFVDNTAGIGQGQTVAIFGSGGSTVIVSNEQGNVAMLIDNAIAHTLDLSGLDNFVTDLNQFNLGDYSGYPNFFNFDENSANNAGITAGQPRQFLSSINFAKTNVIRAIFADPFHYTNVDSRHYSLSFLNSELSGTSTQAKINLGISNLFLLDSVNFVGGQSQGAVQFNAALRVFTNVVGTTTNFVTNAMSAVFRGTNGGRMTVFSVSDGGGTNTSHSNVKATVNFGASAGTLDVLTDQLYLGRDRRFIDGSGNPNYQGFLQFGNGIVDANIAMLGFRQFNQTTNTQANWNGYCEGQVTVFSNGVFKVNESITLGSTVATNANAIGSGGNTEYGEVTILNGGTFIANQVNVGGPAFGFSKNNFIIISNNATMVLSNTIGGPQQSLDTLLVANNSTNVMNIDGANPGPYIFATNLVTAGNNTIRIASIKNLGSITGPIQLMSFSAGGGSFQLIMPAGVGGALLSSNNGVFLQILLGTPKNIVWRGFASSDWDLTTANWLDLSTGLHTNFASGDFVSFDDASGIPTTVHLAGGTDIIPGSIGMTNALNAYVIDNPLNDTAIKGSAILTKAGTNSVEIDAITSLNIQLNEGALTGTGAIASAVITAGNIMNFGGAVLNGVTCAGTATLTGNGAGNLVVQSTGVLTNAGTFIGTFSLSSGAQFYNIGTLGASDVASYTAVGNPVVVAGSTFVNSGDIHALTLTVNGTFEDKGTGTLFIDGDVVVGTRGITIAAGGVFIPGGDGIGTTTINFDNTSPNNFPGRLLFSTSSTNIFKVSPGTTPNTEVLTVYMGWGPNEMNPAINGGTLLISNFTGVPFAAGQTFTLVQNSFGGNFFNASTNTTNAQPIIVPASPGPGLAWDLSTIIQNGVLGVVSVATAPTNILFATSFGTLVVTNGGGTPIGTNRLIISDLRWPPDHIGWELQEQNIGNSNGVSTISSNWTTLAGSSFTNEMLVTNTLTTNGSQLYFRMIYP